MAPCRVSWIATKPPEETRQCLPVAFPFERNFQTNPSSPRRSQPLLHRKMSVLLRKIEHPWNRKSAKPHSGTRQGPPPLPHHAAR
jgi:hypothetical protein